MVTNKKGATVPSVTDIHTADKVNKVLEYVNKHVTAVLLERGKDDITPYESRSELLNSSVLAKETLWNYNVDNKYFVDRLDPRRSLFFPYPYDYSLRPDGTFVDNDVQQQYRNLQLTNQMHRYLCYIISLLLSLLLLINNVNAFMYARCCFTCFKYTKRATHPKCRFRYPIENTSTDDQSTSISHVITDVDGRGRSRIRVSPHRNNANMNATVVSPLYCIALGGNIDLQYIGNERGAAEYCACYTGKVEAPDSSTCQLIMTKYYSRARADNTVPIPLKEHLKAVGNAILNSTSVGATQAMWVLLKLPFVMMSRSVLSVNPLPRSQVRVTVITDINALQHLPSSDPAVSLGYSSQLGRRRCYHIFVKKQIQLAASGLCNISFFTLLTHFQFSKSKQLKNQSKFKQILLLKCLLIVHQHLILCTSRFK